MKNGNTSSSAPYNATSGIETFKNYNSWDIIFDNHDIIKGIIEFLSFPHISINRSMVMLIYANKNTRDYIFEYLINQITVKNQHQIHFLLDIIEKKSSNKKTFDDITTKTKNTFQIKILSWYTNVAVLSNILKSQPQALQLRALPIWRTHLQGW